MSRDAAEPVGRPSKRDLVAARYGDADRLATIAGNPIIDALIAHRSVRAYRPDPLPVNTIETLVAAAQSAASSSNLQLWSVVAIEDAARKARLAKLAGDQQHIIDAPLFLVWLIDFDRLTQIGQAAGAVPRALDYTESLILGIVDASLAAQNAVVALEALGLGSVYIGGIRNHPVQVAVELALPQRLFPLFGLVVGWPDAHRPAAIKPRLPQDAVLFREQYQWDDTKSEAVSAYNGHLRSFQRTQAMAEIDWTAQALRRTEGPSSMAGRDKVKDVLSALGFPLL